jgi:hypothetical protein
LYVFFGSGSQNTLWAFQITFVGAVAFGLLQLVLADHSGPLDRRDWLGLGCGLLAIACAGVAVTMIAIVGIALLIRGRWRAALFHTVPLGLLWGLWTLRFAAQPPFVTTPRVLLDWDRIGLGATFRSLGYVAPVGWALAAMLIAGLVLVLRQWDTAQRARVAAPLAMLAGLFLFMTITGSSRAVLGLQAAMSSRYLDVTAVLVLPALAVAADALARRHRMLLAVVLALLVFGIPGNIAAVRRNVPPTGYFRAYRQLMTSLPRMSLAMHVPGSVHPEPNQAPTLTISWLLDAARSGRLPQPRPSTARERAANIVRLSLDQSSSAPGSSCRSVYKPVLLNLRKGDAFTIEGRVAIQLVRDRVRSIPVVFGAGFLTGAGPHELVDVGGPLALRLSKPRPDIEGSICKSPSDPR